MINIIRVKELKTNPDKGYYLAPDIMDKRKHTVYYFDGAVYIEVVSLEGFKPTKSHKSIISPLLEELSKDQSEGSYYHSWKANIAMSIQDEIRRYTFLKDGRSVEIEHSVANLIANNAAENFLQQLIAE